MICPHCNTENDPKNQYCQKCGKTLYGTPQPAAYLDTQTARELVFSHAFRLIVSLFGLWIIKEILLSFSFVKEIRIPDLPMTVPNILSLLILLIIFFLLLGFLPTFLPLWNTAFPRAAGTGIIFQAGIFLILLGVIYKIITPIIWVITTESTPILILQLLLLLLALIIVFATAGSIHSSIPVWIKRIKETWTVTEQL